MILATTLTIAAAAAIVNLWLSIRVGQVRMSEKVSIGDGGNDRVVRRMRAHANFVENTPLVLILIAALEMSGKGGNWLLIVGGLYILGRVAHGLGMDEGTFAKGRMIGTLITMATLLGLAVVGLLAVYGVI